jgi:hypothetical protein
MEVIALIPQRACKEDKEVEDALRVLLFELRFCLQNVEFDEKFATMMSYSIAPKIMVDFMPGKPMSDPEISTNETLHELPAIVYAQQDRLVPEELNFHSVAINDKTSEKIAVMFTPAFTELLLRVQRAVSFPEVTVLLKEKTDLGKQSLIRFVA